MKLKFDWLIILENLRRGIMVTDAELEPPDGPRIIYANKAWFDMTGYTREDIKGKTPRIMQGPRTDRRVLDDLREKLSNREVFHGQTWNYRKDKKPFLMNWYCYAVYGDASKALYYIAEQEDVTMVEALRMRQRLLVNPMDPMAREFFEVFEEAGFDPRKV